MTRSPWAQVWAQAGLREAADATAWNALAAAVTDKGLNTNLPMNQLAYLELCRRTGVLLDLDDPALVGTGLPFALDGIRCQSVYTEGLPGILLLVEIGPVTHYDRAAVYEQLLEMQLMYWSLPDLRFGFNSARGSVTLCMTFPLGNASTAEAFADLIRAAANQVVAWKRELLAGKVGRSDELEAMMGAIGMGTGQHGGERA